jgi:hypothetical protein
VIFMWFYSYELTKRVAYQLFRGVRVIKVIVTLFFCFSAMLWRYVREWRYISIYGCYPVCCHRLLIKSCLEMKVASSSRKLITLYKFSRFYKQKQQNLSLYTKSNRKIIPLILMSVLGLRSVFSSTKLLLCVHWTGDWTDPSSGVEFIA